jgi:hypothetical protein
MKEIKVTAEEQELIFKGIRPEDMDKNVFKKVRKDMQKAYRMYKGGQFKHISVNLNPTLFPTEAKGTYIRTESKVLGRKKDKLAV